MNQRLVVGFLLVLSLTGCQSIWHRPTESMHVKQMKVSGIDLAYVEEGSGTTVVFVHGASGDWRTWDGFRPYVSTNYRFVSLSRRYHYPNIWTDDGRSYTFDQQVEDVVEFIRMMNVGKVHLVGNSYGGRLVGVLALKHPELLRSVVLGESSLVPPNSAEGHAAFGAYGKELGGASAAVKSGDNRKAAILVANAVLDNPEGFNKMSSIAQTRWLDNEKTMAPMFSGRPPAPVTCDHVKELKVPVLVVRGEKSRANFKYGHDALMSCLPAGADAVIVPNGTHFWATDNLDDATRAVLSFLGKH